MELAELQGLGTDLEAMGFEPLELAELLGTGGQEGLTDPDEAPEPPVNPVATSGDLWALGRHRLLCGDSTKAEDVERVLGGVKPHLMVTDPPYGVSYDPGWRAPHGEFGAKIVAVGKVQNDDRADWSEVWALFPGDVAYVWHGALHATVVAESLAKSDFAVRSQIVWVKPSAAMSRGDYHWRHEPSWYAVRKSKTGHWSGDRKQNTVWEFPGVNPAGGGGKGIDTKVGHGTQKPVECMKRPIENNSSPGQAVYDPFVGSGTTIIAAEMTVRSCHAIELDPAYVDVCIKRWQDFTGEKATLESDGRTFEEIAAERLPKAA